MVAVLATAPGLKADQSDKAVREGHAVTTGLSGNASAVTYWVNEPRGWRVVTTVNTTASGTADSDNHAIIRFSSSLLPGQSQLISVPAASGQPQPILRIRRLADGLEVVPLSTASD